MRDNQNSKGMTDKGITRAGFATIGGLGVFELISGIIIALKIEDWLGSDEYVIAGWFLALAGAVMVWYGIRGWRLTK